LNILHITNWYPNKIKQNEAIWIKKQIETLEMKNKNTVYHFNIIKSKNLQYYQDNQANLKQRIIGLPFQKWFLFEIIYGLWLAYQFLVKKIHKEYDVINFHIAYPILTYWHWIKKWVDKPIVITEHWSAYHYNFGVNKKLPRVEKIFQQKIPVITVSKALGQDIKSFAKTNFENYTIPNVVDEKVFNKEDAQKREPFLFMVSQWKSPKTPLVVMEAFLKSNAIANYTLEIGGYGPMWDEMQAYVIEQKAEDKIKLLGVLDSKQISNKMQRCAAFLHPSDYETFSVVCAEAVACGAFVIALEIGGIPEVVENNGLLIKENNHESWKRALRQIPNSFTSDYNRRFATEKVGEEYSRVLKSVIEDFGAKR